ncbi:hypothetical protein AB0F81_43770 [Actinoplanes sp. NPDC024001]|uniref:hypothetical protein n=1 Tax=Actinoplanes sp. NPDC024001 TaxID=3154598 RepID=UPI0034071B6E
MIEIAYLTADSWVAPEHFHARWCDVETHPEWAPGMEYLRLDGPLVKGARGVMKAKDGPECVFIVSDLVPGVAYQDTVVLDGAELTVRHESHPHGTGSRLELHVRMDGPKAAERAAEMNGLADALASDLAGLVALVERNAARVG